MRSLADFSPGKKGAPWWAASVAFAAGELSALTVVGLPAAAFRGDWTPAQLLIGSAAARVLVAYALLPSLFSARPRTAYGWLSERVGPLTGAAGIGLFFATRLLGGAARLMAAGIAVAALLGCQLWQALIPLALVAGAALSWGGVRAVVWLGGLQAAAAGAAALGALGYLSAHVDGGIAGIWQLAQQSGLELVRVSPSGARFFADPGLLWACVVSGLFGGAATFGADQEQVQRLLCARDLHDARKALLVSVVWGAILVVAHLLLGAGLLAFYRLHPGLSLPTRPEHVYPHFAATAAPAAVRWLTLVSLALISLDVPVVSMAAVAVGDVYRALRPRLSEKHGLEAARVCAAVFTAWLAIMAWVFARAGGSLWLALKIGAITLGPLLGAFIVAATHERPDDRATASAMAAMVAVCAALLALAERGSISLASTWLVAYGAVGVAGLSWGLAPLLASRDEAK